MSRVLLAEDERHLALGLRFNLENAGYEVQLVETGEEALAAIRDAPFDLIILDVTLAGELDGFEVARAVRHEGDFAPILMLTARDLVEDRVSGIDAGADDYLTKPFDLDELMARVRALLRRQVWSRRRRRGGDPSDPKPTPESLLFGECRIDFNTYRATTCHGEEVQLSAKEAEVMRLFSANEGQIIARATFLEQVWGDPGTLETRTVDNFIMRLRKYFEPDPKHPRHILSIRGVGYRFVR
ncbi:response regulator transcription factor [Planctomycetota bacterium]